MPMPENVSTSSNNNGPRARNQEDAGGNAEVNYKAQLDAVADQARNPDGDRNGNGGVLDKVADYVPAVGHLLGKTDEEQAKKEQVPSRDVPGPPERPAHDTQIQEFVRDQHRSKDIHGVME